MRADSKWENSALRNYGVGVFIGIVLHKGNSLLVQRQHELQLPTNNALPE